jgi:predicted acetyltransferase
MERCPCCNARLKEALICPRCQANLSAVIGSEQAAEQYLAKAIQHWAQSDKEQSLRALVLSLSLKKTQIAVAFRDFLIQKYYQEVVQLLGKKQLLSANQCLYHARQILPYSPQLQQLQAFTRYLLVKYHAQDKVNSKTDLGTCTK